MEILKYLPEHEDDVLTAISKEPGWELFKKQKNKNAYKSTLKNSITYVCYNDKEFCGYVRAILDDGFAAYISELFVVPKWRNNKIGQLLIERLRNECKSLTVYVLSDEDAYYIKKGYKKIG
jgi:GNAT superfamily N-acetyltransferase